MMVIFLHTKGWHEFRHFCKLSHFTQIVDLIMTVKVLNSVLHVQSAKSIAIIYLSISQTTLG